MEVSVNPQPRRLRSACDLCHASKVRCTGGQPCKKCCNSNLPCTYSYMAKLGKPKGSRNKRTLERLSHAVAVGADSTLNASPTQAATNNTFQLEWPQKSSTQQDNQEKGMPATIVSPFSDASASLLPTILPSTATSCTACTPLINDPSLNLSMELTNILDIDMPLFASTLSPMARDHQSSPDYLDILFTGGSNTNTIFSGHDSDLDVRRRSLADGGDPAVNRSPSSLVPHRNSVSSNCPLEDYEKSSQYPQRREEQKEAELSLPNCICLKMLTGMQCSLKGIERKHGNRRLDIILSMATMILDCSSRALDCDPCLLDGQVLLLIMILLQTVFNWAIVNCYNAKSVDAHKPPAINFGTWNVSEDESLAIKILLVNRIMAKSKTTMNIIRQRIDEIASMESKYRYQPVDSQILYFTLNRVLDALAEVKRHGKEMGTCYD